MHPGTRIELRWLDESTYASIEDAFARGDEGAFVEFAARALPRVASLAAPGLGTRQQDEWRQGAQAVLENFVSGPTAMRADMLGEWADELITYLAVCLALPSFAPMYELERWVNGRYTPLTELCRTGSEWARAMDAAESALATEASSREEFRIVWPAEPSLVILGSLDGGLWHESAARTLGLALLADANPAQRLLGAQAKVLTAAGRVEAKQYAEDCQARPGVGGQVAAQLGRLLTSAETRGYGVVSLAFP